MVITRALPTEADALTTIAVAAKRHLNYPEHWMALWRPLLTVVPEFIDANETFVARERGRIIGWAALVEEAAALRLEHLWVTPSEMGTGVGRALFCHAQQRARALGYEYFEAESDPHAAGFYERMGARRVCMNITLLDGQPRELPVFRCGV